MKTVTITLPEQLTIESKNYAKLTGRTFSGLIRTLLEKELGGKNV